ncbi:MAG: TIGR00304 family membrane protein [Candidatus Bathycorpusculaceae bacterium]
MDEKEKVAETPSSKQQKFLILLFIIGFFIIFLGIIILIIASLVYGEGSVNFGGAIFIWFIPIVFGAGPESQWMILFAIVLAILGIAMFLIMHREIKKTRD